MVLTLARAGWLVCGACLAMLVACAGQRGSAPQHRAPELVNTPLAVHAGPVDERDATALLQWRHANTQRASAALAFEQHLGAQSELAVLPLHQVLRSASAWKTYAGEPFAVPPAEQWPQVVQVLKLLQTLRQRGILGGIETHSGYRDEALNLCAGGASGSAHLKGFALDFTPDSAPAVADALCAFWRAEGAAWQMGLGRYASGRLHIDAMRYRTWGAGC